jgi:hypothetical protein
MPRTQSTFKFSDLSRALRAAKAARVAVDIEITPNKMTVVTKPDSPSEADEDEDNPWLDPKGKKAK